jgi:DNA-binding NarL/FixJ family response regulator
MPIPDDKIALILELYLNNEMEKREVIRAIQRLSIGAFEQEKSDAREKARKAPPHAMDNDYSRWTRPDTERLMIMRAEGYEDHIIARELRRTVRSIRTKYLEVLAQEKETAHKKVGKSA